MSDVSWLRTEWLGFESGQGILFRSDAVHPASNPMGTLRSLTAPGLKVTTLSSN